MEILAYLRAAAAAPLRTNDHARVAFPASFALRSR
jgi:hypothetical protein